MVPILINNKTNLFLAERAGIDLKRHCTYHPESGGTVNGANGANGLLKNRLTKMMEETQLDWVYGLPVVLMYMRGRHHSTIGLSPHEVLTGRVMAIGQNLKQGAHTGQIFVDEAIVAY